MHAELSINLATVYGFLLVLARVSGTVALVPIPGISAGPDASRIVLALALTVALFPVWPAPAMDGLAVGRLLGWIFAEAAFGLTIGVAVTFLLEGVELAAQIIGLEAGYSFASTVDPNTQADTTTLQLMAQLMAGCLFFALGFDHQVVRVLARSLASIPSGTYLLTGPGVEAITRLGSAIFSTGLQLAMPVLALMLLLDIAFGVLGRLHQQLQVLSLSFSVKMLASISFLASVIAFFPRVFEKVGGATFIALARLLNH
jgi:flagellar biosynthetic protein FliR